MGPVFELQITPQNHYYYLLYHSPLKKREGDFLAEKLPAVVSGIVTGVDRTGQLLATYFSPDVLVTSLGKSLGPSSIWSFKGPQSYRADHFLFTEFSEAYSYHH